MNDNFYNVEIRLEHSPNHDTHANLKNLHLKALKKKKTFIKFVEYTEEPIKDGYGEVLKFALKSRDPLPIITSLIYAYWEIHEGMFWVKAVYPAEGALSLYKIDRLNRTYKFDEHDYDNMIELDPKIAQPGHF